MRLVIPHFIDPYYTYIVCKYPTNLFVQSNVLFESENSAWVQFQLELDLLRFGYVSHNKTHKGTHVTIPTQAKPDWVIMAWSLRLHQHFLCCHHGVVTLLFWSLKQTKTVI
jgi:hypothetical protein